MVGLSSVLDSCSPQLHHRFIAPTVAGRVEVDRPAEDHMPHLKTGERFAEPMYKFGSPWASETSLVTMLPINSGQVQLLGYAYGSELSLGRHSEGRAQ